jgi:hypothetical protein
MTDQQLIAQLDAPGLYFVAAAPDASGTLRSLREALCAARNFERQRLTPTVRRMGESVEIPQDQMLRLWRHLEL